MKDRLIKISKIEVDYLVPLPPGSSSSKVKKSIVTIKFIDDKYHYIPRNHTFFAGVRYTSYELRLIADELDRLNEI